MFEIKTLKKVHFIGITSGFNSFCANYLLNKGIQVTASEINQDSQEASEWIKKGILYKGGHNSKYITDDLDLVVYPNGPIPGNPECEEAEKKGIKSITIAQLTGIISENFKVIAIAGTHGKTTTSSLVVWMLYKEYSQIPNFIIGDHILDWNKSWNYNPDSEYLVIEACEYKRQFLDRVPTPYISVITNVELDHTDYYKSQDDYNNAFSEFISNSFYGLVVDSAGININSVLEKIKNKDFKIIDCKNIKEKYSTITANLKGNHNRENVLRACGVAELLHINPNIEDFPGVSLRFEYKGKTINGMPVYLDYAHNPRKISACLQEAKEIYPDKKILFVWQPHSFERTYSFKNEFSKSILEANTILLPNIFAPTREKDNFKDLITEKSFVDYLKEKNKDKEIVYTKDFETTAEYILSTKYNEEYVCILASAGDLKNILPLLNLSIIK